MSVEIDPLELGFRRTSSALPCVPDIMCPSEEARSANHIRYLLGPFTVEVSQILKLKNPNKSPVAFKVGLHRLNWTLAAMESALLTIIGQNYRTQAV